MACARASLVLVAAVAGSLGACKRAPSVEAPTPQPTLGAVTVTDVTPAEQAPAHLDVGALERALRGRLLATGLFEREGADAATPPGAPKRPVTRVLARVGIDGAEVDGKGLARARAALRLET